MLISWLDQFLRATARARRYRRVRASSQPVKINVGAGVEVAKGWINVDGGVHALISGAPRPVLSLLYRNTGSVRTLMAEDEYVRRMSEHRFVFHDLAFGLPFESDVADFVFCSHVLEHFGQREAEQLLGEIFRVLKPGGHVRICVPDLEKAVRLYEQGAKSEALRYFFSDGRSGSYDQHRYMYDYELLQAALRQQGFSTIARRTYRQGQVPDLERLDNRPDETLYVEAVKQTVMPA
ncbi:MAG: class I SAM-dependent methyltransferase [Gemmatimonadota bacterium]